MNTKDILVLTMVKGIGPAFIKRNIKRINKDNSCESLIYEFRPEEKEFIEQYYKNAEEIISICQKENIDIIPLTSDCYPKRLLEISDSPSILYLKGNKSLLNNVLSIIGTRHSTSLGNKIAERLGSYFSTKFAICNGLVEGIDEHSVYVGGKILSNVIGIISGGMCYKETCSQQHQKIIDDVLSNGGLIISEFSPLQKEDKYSGSKASRIQAGLSCGLILVQSKIDGGSKYTIASFSKLNRAIGVIHFPNSEEYNLPEFSANRLIVEKGICGIAEMIGLKTTSNIKIKSITKIECKADYDTFIDSINNQHQPQMSNLFD